MKKSEIKVPGDNTAWGTIKTKYPADTAFVGQNELTGNSKNFDTTVKGIVTKRKDAVLYNPIDFGAVPKDQYEAIFTDGVRHLLVVAGGTLKYSSGGGTFSDVTTGYASTSNFEFTIYDDKVYFGNGINASQVYDRTASYGGVTYTVPKTKVMGAQAPISAPTVGVHTAGGAVPAGAHTYKVTYLYYDVEESNGGTATGVTTVVGPNFTVPLTSVPIGGYGVTARKIYRDDNDGVYRLVGTINDNTTTTYSDAADVGTALIPDDHDVPPTFKYIITHLDRNWIAGITGDSSLLRFSDAGLPNVFPLANSILCNPKDPITALVVFNDRIIVFNRNSIGQILGTTSDTFRYSEIPSAIGCVDNRSVQIRTIVGVPVLVWLSDKGFYSYNGSSVNYISDPIEDLVNLNIQQSQQIKGQNAQTTESQFNSGTKTPAILTTGGVITVADPVRTWNDETDWEGGSSLTNIATKKNNEISVPTTHAPQFSDGTHNNTSVVSGTLRTPVSIDFTGNNNATGVTYIHWGNNANDGGLGAVAIPFTVPRSGTLTSITTTWNSGSGSIQVGMKIYSNLAGTPGSELYTSPTTYTGTSLGGSPFAFSAALTGNTTYWAVIHVLNRNFGNVITDTRRGISTTYVHHTGGLYRSVIEYPFSFGYYPDYAYMSFSFVSSPIPTSGLWIGPTHDTYSTSTVTSSVDHTGIYPGSVTTTTTVEAADSSDFTTNYTSQSFTNVNGAPSVTITNRRYFRLKILISTTDDRYTAQVGLPMLRFNTTGTWISEVLDHTTDITALASLAFISSSVPSGTSATVEIATSADNITYTSYGPIGISIPQRYSKVRVILTTNAYPHNLTSSVQSLALSWDIVASLISSVIDTGNTPAGWDIFQSSYEQNGGTVTLELRTASAIVGLPAATWYPAYNGVFPTAPVNRYANWRVTINAPHAMPPTVDSVALNWFISNVNSIRVASLFYNRAYYLAAAEYNQTANNLMLVLDGEGNWRIYRDLSVNTLSLFFNDPYYGSSVTGKIYRFLEGNTNSIEFILETKEFDLDYPDKTKILRNVRINGNSTGAKYYPQFSADGGVTWVDMINPYTGLNYLQTLADGSKFSNKFVPVFLEGQVTAGRTIKLRVLESTNSEVELESLQAEIWIRAGERNG